MSLLILSTGANLLKETLQPAPARYDARDTALACLEGTRTKILYDISDWIFSASQDQFQIFWL
ncbi:hypothetical protein FRB96_002950, partial [Tulasnella sp. 330]